MGKRDQSKKPKQVRSKARTSIDGRASGGTNFSRGALYHLLNNRIYLGEIVHREQSYPGLHQPIVPRSLWDRVVTRLKKNNKAQRRAESHSTPSLLSGKLFDTNGIRFTPTHSVKNKRRYHYYTSQAAIRSGLKKPAITRFPARELEALVRSRVYSLLLEPAKLTAGIADRACRDAAAQQAKDMATQWPNLEISKQSAFIKNIFKRYRVCAFYTS